MTANVKKCRVVICNEDKLNPVTFIWKWGEADLPTAHQYTYPCVEISKDCSWDVRIANVMGKGKACVGKTNAILTDSHLDSTVGLKDVLCDCTKASICRSMGRERELRETAGNSAEDGS